MRLGFHGDKYLLSLVESLIQKAKVTQFVETGSAHGHTLKYVAETYSHLDCYSCELSNKRFVEAKDHCNENDQVHLFNMTSPDFLNQLPQLENNSTLYWLDAHGGGFTWPLRDEVDIITHQGNPCYVLIDDFRVPNSPQFGFDSYKGQQCEHEFIEDNIHWEEYELFYPRPYEHTSTFHPLRGWGLYVYNLPTDFIDDRYALRYK